MKSRPARGVCFSIVMLGTSLSLFVFSQARTQLGYTIVTARDGSRIPVAAALFTYTNSSGILVSQAGVGAVEPIASGKIFVDQNGTETGFALVNPSAASASISLTLYAASGIEAERQSLTLDAGIHTARFVSEFFKNLPPGFTGSMTFQSTQKLAAITLRQSTNARGEPLYTTLPVVDLSQPPSVAPLIFPQIAAGEGYSTQLILINPSAQRQRGKIAFYGSDGSPLPLKAGATQGSQLTYELEGQGAYRVELEKEGAVKAGYAVVTPEWWNTTPSGSAVFRYQANGKLVTEAGVGGTRPTTAARIFVDNADTLTGVALASSENQGAALSLTLLDKNGVQQQTITRDLPAKGHLAAFVNELFPGLDGRFTGQLEITSTLPVSAITLKLTINRRNELVYATLPVADLNNPPAGTQMIFPQIAIGEGFSARLISINADRAGIAKGTLIFWRSDATPMTVQLGNRTSSEFPFQVAAGGTAQWFPGATAKLSGISILDPERNQITNEITVNEGNTVKASLLVLDETGTPRDDFLLSYTSLDPDVAAIDADGFITGKKAGFSTITISAGGIVAAGTLCVVAARSGAGGYDITGIVQDSARRLYLTATGENAILRIQELGQKAEVYAGVRGTGGFRNDERLKSLFRKPAFLCQDRATGMMFVSDGDNHVIRKIQPGPDGKVLTYAGMGDAGSADGPAAAAKFNNPQGVTLDNRGCLWVADAGNHTVRRISLVSGITETVAGKAGQPGWADGKGSEARFNNPVGIALETESLARQLEREARGEAPPPITVLIADTGNGVIRRVKETGEVETILTGSPAGQAKAAGPSDVSGAPLTFASPKGVAVDPFGNIYVSEPRARHVRAILQDGRVASPAQANTFAGPAGIAINDAGRLVVADAGSSALEIVYGIPKILKVMPDRISIRGGQTVTIKGRNFSPDSTVILAGKVIRSTIVSNTATIELTAPSGLPSGSGTVTVLNRSGLAQSQLLVEPTPLSELLPGHITTYAGGTTYAGEGSLAPEAQLREPWGIALDSAGNLYIAERANNRVCRVAAGTGIVTTVAGTGQEGFSGDNGLAVAARLWAPRSVAVDPAGSLYIADTFNQRIRKVSAATGVITTIAGNGEQDFSGDGGPAVAAKLKWPATVTLDMDGSLYIADCANHRIRKIEAATGIIKTIAGTGEAEFSGDGGPAVKAALFNPAAVAPDAAGNVYIADTDNHRIRWVSKDTGLITTVAGNGTPGFSGDRIPAVFSQLRIPGGVFVDSTGNLWISDGGNARIRRVSADTGFMETVAGSENGHGYSGDAGPANAAQLAGPIGITIDSAGNLLIADCGNQRVRLVASRTGIISTLAGNGESRPAGDGGLAIGARLRFPTDLALDAAGDLLVADQGSHSIRKVSARTGLITTVAGTGAAGFVGDDRPATAATIFSPKGIAVGPGGSFYISDNLNNRIRRVNASTGIITTVAGNGEQGFSGDGGPATAAQINSPHGVAIDASGNLFFADTYNHRIRTVSGASGIITTVAGTGEPGFSGEGEDAKAARLNWPEGVAIDPAGDLLFADQRNHRIRRVATARGTISTIAGTGQCGHSGDGGPATSATLCCPSKISLDAMGNLWIADTCNQVVRKIAAGTGIISTIAGTGEASFGGDGGPALAAELFGPNAVVADGQGNVFIADGINNRIRVIRGPIP